MPARRVYQPARLGAETLGNSQHDLQTVPADPAGVSGLRHRTTASNTAVTAKCISTGTRVGKKSFLEPERLRACVGP